MTSLAGLDDIDAGSITNLKITNNNSLSTCEVQSICDYLASPNGTIEISDNATGCDNQAQVIAACEAIGVEEIVSEECYSIFPNPVADRLTLNYHLTEPSFVQCEIYNCFGQKVSELVIGLQPGGTHEIEFNTGNFQKGLYILKVITNGHEQFAKFIKTN